MKTRGPFSYRLKTAARRAARRLAWTAAFSASLTIAVRADPPITGTVVAGSATFNQNGSLTTITASNNTIINFPSFNIPVDTTVQFVQPGASSRVLGRVTGGSPTQIFGSLTANGIVYLVNPAGIYFGPTSYIDVGALYTASGNLSNRDFLDGSNHFTNLGGAVINAGTIQAQSINLFGRTVANLGTIYAPNGAVVMAAGDDVFLGERGGRVFVQTSTTTSTGDSVALAQSGTGVANSGRIDAKGGQVLLAAGDLYSVAIQQSGVVTGRDVQLEGQGRGEVWNSGAIDASARESGATGGRVQITGEKVGLAAGSTIDASGDAGGGTILVGGDFQGGNAEVRNATATFADATASLHADALASGNGGRVIVWSNEATRFYGGLSAHGGAGGGDGGFAEVSGKNYLDFSGTIDLTSVTGLTGSLLLDPRDLTIDNSSDSHESGDGSSGNPFSPSAGGSSTLTWTTIKGALAGGNVTVDTNTGGSETGNITVGGSTSYNSSHRLTLTTATGGSIFINASITNSGSGGLTLKTAGSGGGITLGDNLSFATGTITLNPGGAVTQTGGKLTAATLALDGPGQIGTSGTPISTDIGELQFVTKSAGDVFIANSHGSAMTLDGSMNGSLTLTAQNAIQQTASVQIGGSATFKTLNDGGAAITLDDSGNTFGSSVSAQVRNAADSADASADITIADGGAVGLGRIRTAGNLTVIAGGAITQAATATVGSTASFKTLNDGGSNITIDDGNNTFGVFSAQIRNAADAANANGTITLVEAGPAALGALGTSGTLNVTSSGAISQSGGASAVAATGNFKTLNDGGAAITLDSSGNAIGAFSAQVRNAADNATTSAGITLNNTGAVSLGTLATGSSLDLTSTGAITQSAAAQIGGAASFKTLNDSGAAITLDQSSNTFGSVGAQVLTSGGAGGPSSAIVVHASGALTLDTIKTNGNLSVGATGAITQSAGTIAGGLASFDTQNNGGAAITLDASGNSFGSISATTHDLAGNIVAGDVTIKEGDSTVLAGVSTHGNLNVTSSGNISQTGALAVGGTGTFTVSTASSDLSLASFDNDVAGAISLSTSGSGSYHDVALRNVHGGAAVPTLPSNLNNVTLQFPNAAVVVPSLTLTGNLSVLAGGAITDANGTTLSVAGSATFDAGSNAITLGDFGTDLTNFGSLSLTGGAVNVSEDSSMLLNGVSASSLTLTANGSITQNTGTTIAITGAGATTFTVAGGSDLNLPEANSFGGSLTFTTTSGSYHDLLFRNTASSPGTLTLPSSVTHDLTATFDSAAITLPSLSVGNNLTVTAAGITDAVGANLSVTGRATFNAGSHDITLGQDGADTTNFGSLAFAGHTIAISEDSSMTLETSSGGAITLVANGSLSQNGLLTATGATLFTVATGADILLDSFANDVRGAVTFAVTGGGALRDLQFRTISGAASIASALPTTPRNLSLVFDAAPITLSALTPTGTVYVNAGGGLTLTGNITTVNKTVSLTGSSISLPASFALNTGGGAVSINGPVTVTNGTSITTAGGNLTFSSSINDSVSGTSALTFNAGAGQISFGGAIGGVNPVGSLAATGSSILLKSVTTTGSQTYTGPVTLQGNTVLNGSTLSFTSTLDGGGFDLTLASSSTKSINAGFTGIHDFTTSGIGQTQLGGTFTTSGTQTFNGPVALLSDTTLSATTFVFGGAVTGAGHSLALNHALATTLNLGNFSGLASFAVGSSAVSPAPVPTTTLFGSLSTTGNEVFSNPVSLNGATALSAPLTHFLSTLDGGQTLGITGAATFDGSVGGTTALTSLSVTGATILNGAASLVRTTAGQTFSSTVTLNTATTLDTGSGATVGAVSGNNNNLIITASGTIDVNSAFSGLNSLTVTAPTTHVSGTVTTTGGQTFNSNVVLTGDTTLTSSNDQNITITGTVDGGHNLTVGLGATATPGTVTFGGNVGSSSQPVNLTVTGAGQTEFDGQQVYTSGNQSYGGLVTAAPSGGSIAFRGVTGTFSGGLRAPGIDVSLQFTDLIYQTSTFSMGTLAVTTTSKAQILGTNPLTTTGAQTYNGVVELANGIHVSGTSLAFNGSLKLLGDATITATTGGLSFGSTFTSVGDATLAANTTAIFNGVVNLGATKSLDLTATSSTFNGRILGPGGLAVHGDARFNAFVGYNGVLPLNPLSSLSVSGNTVAAAESLPGFGTLYVTGTETFSGATTLLGNIQLSGTSATFTGAVDGPGGLSTIASPMPVTFNSTVGHTTALAFLSLDAVNANGSEISTSGNQTYAGTLTLGADTTLNAASLNTAAVQGAHDLTLAVSGASSIGAVGSVTTVGSGTGAAITINSTGSTNFTGTVNTVTGLVQNSNSAVTFGGNVTIGSGGADSLFNGSVTFNGTQFLSGGAVTFGNAGTDTLTIGNAGGAAITTATAGKAVTINAATTLNGALTVDTGAGALAVGAVNGAKALTLTSSGGINITNTLGGTTALASLTINGGATLNGAAIRTNGTQVYNGPLTLGTAAALTVLNLAPAQITFGGAVDGNFGLSLSAPTVNFNGSVGLSAPLASLGVTAATTNLGAAEIRTSGDQTFSGQVNVAGATNLTTTSGTARFASAVDGAGALTVTGDASFSGAVGAVTPLSALTVTGAAALNGASIRTSGDQSYHGSTTFASDLHLTGHRITIDNAIDSTHGLIITGDAVFGGSIGSLTPLSLLSVSGNTVLQGGVVKTTGTQVYSGSVALNGNTALTGSLVTIGGAVDGSASLAVTGNASFGGLIGDVTPLTALSVSGTTTLSAPRITTTTTQTYSGPINLSGNTTLTGSLVTIGGALDGSLALTISGDGVLSGLIGQTTPLAALTVTGATALNSGFITTTGAQNYNGATALGGNTHLAGSAIDFGGALDGGFQLFTTGATTFNGAVGSGTSLNSLTVTGSTSFNTAIVKTTGAQTYNGASTLLFDTTLNGGSVSFGGTLDGAHALTLTGNAAFAGAVGNGTALSSIQVGGTTALNGASVHTTGTQSYTGAVTLGGNTTLTGATMSFGSTLNGPYALALTGNASFGGAVGGLAPLASLSVSGTSSLNSTTVITHGAQTYTGAMTLGSDASLTVLDPAPAQITFGSGIDGAHALTLSAPIVTLNGAIGSLAPLLSLTDNAATTHVGATEIHTTGDQVFSGNADFSGATQLFTGGGAAQFAGLVDGPGALTIAGNATFTGAVGSISPLASLAITGSAALNGASVRTTGDQTYSGDTTFASNLHLTAHKVTIDHAVNSSHNLTITGDAVFGGSIGQLIPLGLLSVSGDTRLQGGSVTTTGAQTYAGNIALAGDTTLKGSLVTIGGAVDGALALSVLGDASFGGLIGDVTPLNSLSVTGATTLAAPRITTTTTQTYQGAIHLAGDTTLKGSLVTIGGAVDGSLALTINGGASLNGLIGQVTPLAGLTVTGTTALNSGFVTTTGAQVYGGAATLGADAHLTGASINFGGTVNGPFQLLATGATTFNGVVGGAAPLTSLLVNGPTTFNTAAITTLGAQTYAGIATLIFDTTLTSGSNIAFSGTLDGANALTVVGDASFAGAVGATTALKSLDVNGATALNGAAVRTTGGQTYAGATTLGGDSTLTGSLMSFGSTLDGGHALAVVGNAAFGGPVGQITPLASLSVSGISNLNTATITTTGAQAYAGALTLSRDSTLTGSTVFFGGPVSGPFAFTIQGGATFSSTVGAGAPLASLRVTGPAALNGATISTVGAQTYAGATTLGGDTVLTGSTMSFGGNVDGGFGLTINGSADFGGSVGGSTPLASLTLNGPITLKAGIINTTGPQTYGGAVTLSSNNALSASLIRFTGTVDGPFGLTIAHDAFFGGVVGGASPLASLNVGGAATLAAARVTTTGTQTYGGAMALTGDSFLTGSTVRFGSTVDGAFGLNVTGGASFASDVGGATSLASLNVTGDVALGGSRVFTIGLQNYGGSVTLGEDTAMSGSALTFGGKLDGSYALTLTGATTFGGVAGGAAPLASLVVNGTTTLKAAGITTVGSQTFNGAVTLGADAILTGTVETFTGAIDGADALSIVGAANLGGAVGQTTALTSLAVTGDAKLGGGIYATTGSQHFGGTVELGADTTFTASSVMFDHTLDGAFALTINGRSGAGSADLRAGASPGATAVFGGAVGQTTALTSLAVNGTSLIQGAAVNTTGSQTWNGAVTLGSDVQLSSPRVTLADKVDGNKNLKITGDLVLGGAVGGTAPVGSLTVGGTTQFNAGTVATTGAQTYTGAATLNSDVAITTSGGSVTFRGAVASPSNRSLNVATPTGFVAFYSSVGLNGGPLGSLRIDANDMELADVVTTGNQFYGSAAGAVTMLTGNLRSENGDIEFSSRRSEVPVIATIFKNSPGDLLIETPNGDFTMGPFERLLVSGGTTSADSGGNMTLNVGGTATLGDFAVSKLLTVRANRIDLVGSYLQATDIELLTTGGTLMPISSITFKGAPTAAGNAQVSLSTRNATPFAPASSSFVLRLLNPVLFVNNRIAPENFPTRAADGGLLFQEFNIFPVFLASSRTNLSEVLSGATPTATVEVAQEAAISSAVRDQLVLLGIFARQLTSAEEAARRKHRTIYQQIIPEEVREPDKFEVADGRVSQSGAIDAVRLYNQIFMRRLDSGAQASRIPEIQQALGQAFRAFRQDAPTAEPAEFASYLRSHPQAEGAAEVQKFFEEASMLFRTIESLGLTDQEIAVSKTVLLRPLRVVGLPSSVLRHIIESVPSHRALAALYPRK